MDLEHEITKLRGEIREAEETDARERASAEATVERMRASGADLTAKDNFDALDAAFKPADAARERAAEKRKELDRFTQLAGGQAAPRSRDEEKVAHAAAKTGGAIQRFIESDDYKRFRESSALRSKQARVHMDPIEDVITREEMLSTGLRLRTTFDNSAGIGSGLLIPDYTGKMVDVLVRKVRLLDVVTIGSTDTDTIDWIVENARTDSAAPTAYGTAVPESAYGFSHLQTTVKRVGHFVPATKGILADAGQTRTLLSSRLVNGLEREVESQVWSGGGTGEDLAGIVGTSGILTHALGADTQYDAVHKAITAVRVGSLDNIEPTVLGIHPTDFEKLVLAKTSQGAYLNADPSQDSSRTVWGLVPVVSTLFTAGNPYVGDFREAVTVWLREGVSVAASDQHADFFLRGLVALMAETRLGMAVTRPSALCQVTGF